MSWSQPPSPPADKPERPAIMVDANNFDDAIAEILAKGDKVAQAMARGVAAGFPQAVHEWFNAEAERGGADKAVQALIGLQIAIFAGICGPALPIFLHKPLADLYRSAIDRQMVAGMAACHDKIHGKEARP